MSKLAKERKKATYILLEPEVALKAKNLSKVEDLSVSRWIEIAICEKALRDTNYGMKHLQKFIPKRLTSAKSSHSPTTK